MPAIELRGLREAAENLRKIGKVAATELSRDALRDGALVVNRAVKAATYTTFQRRTGFIKAGFGVRVAKELKGDVLRAWIVQYEQSLAGGSAEKKAQRAAYLPAAKGRKQSFYNLAFWWRFLEFGTKGRRNARTSKGARISKKTGLLNLRTRRAKARYDAAKSLGDIAPRPWVRPAFGGSAAGAIETFDRSFRRRLSAEIDNLPK